MARGARGVIVGVFGSSKDLLDSAYQYPGGLQLKHHLGPHSPVEVLECDLAVPQMSVAQALRSWLAALDDFRNCSDGPLALETG